MKRNHKKKRCVPLAMYAAAIPVVMATVMVTTPVQEVIAEVIEADKESESIVGNWKASEAGINGVKISADMVGLGDFFVTISEDENGENTADLTYSNGKGEPVEIHGLKIVEEPEKNGEDETLRFDVNIPSSDTPSLSEGQKILQKWLKHLALRILAKLRLMMMENWRFRQSLSCSMR